MRSVFRMSYTFHVCRSASVARKIAPGFPQSKTYPPLSTGTRRTKCCRVPIPSEVGYCLLAGDEEHVPGPAPELRAPRVFDLRAVAELVSVPVGAPRLLVIK